MINKKQSYTKILKEYNIKVLQLLAKNCDIPLTHNGKYKNKEELIKDINNVLKKIKRNKIKYQKGGNPELTVDTDTTPNTERQLSAALTPLPKELPEVIGEGTFGKVYRPALTNIKDNKIYIIDKNDNNIFILKDFNINNFNDNKYIGKVLNKSFNIDFNKTVDSLKENSLELYNDIYNDIIISKIDSDNLFTIKLEGITIIDKKDDKKDDKKNIQLIYQYGGISLQDFLSKILLKDKYINDLNKLKTLLKVLLKNIKNNLLDNDIYHLDIRLPNILYDVENRLNLIDFGLFINSHDKIINFIKYLFENNMLIYNRPFEYDVIHALKNTDPSKEHNIILIASVFYLLSPDTRKMLKYNLLYQPKFYIRDDLILDDNNIKENKENLKNYLETSNYLKFKDNTKQLCEKITVFYIGVILYYINSYSDQKFFNTKLIDKCLEMNYLNRCTYQDILNNIDKEDGIDLILEKQTNGGKYKKNNNKNILNNKMKIKKLGGETIVLPPQSQSITTLNIKNFDDIENIKNIDVKKFLITNNFIKDNENTEDTENTDPYSIRQIVYDDFMDNNIKDLNKLI